MGDVVHRFWVRPSQFSTGKAVKHVYPEFESATDEREDKKTRP